MTGARTGSPDIAARAQAAFDCWMLESGEEGDPGVAQACRYNAMNALAELESASTGARLHTAGGPVQPQGQSYVVQPGTPAQTIHAPGGYTIEVITTHHAAAVAPAPAHYTTTVPYAAPQMVEVAPMVHPAPVVEYVEASPIIEESMAPAMMAPIAMETVEVAMAPLPAMQMIEAAPIVTHSTSIPTVDLGPIEAVPTFTMAPIETVPVFETTPVESMPVVEINPLPIFDGSDAAQALVDASVNMGGDFSVFFGFDSDEVTLEAEDVLVDAVERIRLSGASRVSLVGFTDSMGNARYNQLLAMRRAQSVRKFLQEKLGNDVTFEILPVGEVQAVQNGGDGIKEALNRKVQINLQ